MTFQDQGLAARRASFSLATLDRASKDAALHEMADALLDAKQELLDANARDVDRARQQGTAQAMLDRLSLSDARIDAMAAGLRQLAALPDPVGDVVRGWRLPNGVSVSQVRVPLGVLGIIYEARPNVTADAAGIALKSGNAVLLRGSSSALESNRVTVAALRRGLEAAGITPDAVHLVEGGREITSEMMTARGIVDVLIPRGGAGLINAVVEGASVPVIATGTGNCHLGQHDVGFGEHVVRHRRAKLLQAGEQLLQHLAHPCFVTSLDGALQTLVDFIQIREGVDVDGPLPLAHDSDNHC